MENLTAILLNSTIVNPGESIYSDALSLDRVIKLSLTCSGKFNMSKTWEGSGLRVKILSSPDGSTWDITPYAIFDAPSNISKHVYATVSIIPDPSYIKCKIINQNQNETAYECKLIASYAKT